MLEFDTLDKKPTVYNIAFISLLFAGLAALLFLLDTPAWAVGVAFDLYFLVTLVLLLEAFFKQLRYNAYSYSTVYYAGFAFFNLVVLMSHMSLTAEFFLYPDRYPLPCILHSLLDSACSFISLSMPIILIASLGLCASNISLIRHEGPRPVNTLGILLSVLMLLSSSYLVDLNDRVALFDNMGLAADLYARILSAACLYFESMLIGTVIAGSLVAAYRPEPDKDFLIILGCSIRRDGTPTPLLQGRLDRALEFYRQQKVRTGKELYFVTSGGQGPNEVISESACMKRYLLEHGISPERIIEEDQSVNTYENMRFSREKILQIDPNGKIAFSTNEYHLFRSGLLARRVKMRAVGIGAKTKWYFWPNAAVREFLGLLARHKREQARILTGMIVIYVVLTLLSYR